MLETLYEILKWIYVVCVFVFFILFFYLANEDTNPWI